MAHPELPPGQEVVISRDGLDKLLQVLAQRGYRVIGPTVRERAIVYDDIVTTEGLPVGWTDEHEGGHYRLYRRDDRALFGYVVGPHSWKRLLHPPVQQLWRAKRHADGFEVETESRPDRPFAFIGVRPCDLQAIAVQDRVFLEGPYVDPHYRMRREGAFVLAVNCGEARGTCFCVSMQTGPKAESGFDLALTELEPAGDHRFLIEVGSERGGTIVAEVPHRPASEHDRAGARAVVERTVANMGREMPQVHMQDLLMNNLEHPRWDDVAERCLTCGNCTMVCPTCFCTDTEEDLDLTGETLGRTRKWTSCYTLDFSYIHGGGVRSSARSRYRQWLTHKLATWHDQFGTSGCVGCGRCITWCPVGIDLTEEVRAIQGSEPA
ncbi:MAG TPA: 4Fe-4S dicluster domain-containing protein [Geminicoccaceae bacterium]|nr:4Fe-4S dicluster domain-containing protein [Geminicoccaceae bacterium]